MGRLNEDLQGFFPGGCFIAASNIHMLYLLTEVGQMKRIYILCFLLLTILSLCSCLSTSSYYSSPQVVIVNQYDKPMTVTVKSFDLSPSFSDYYLPAYSTYTIIFPREFNSIVTFSAEGAYFDPWYSEVCMVNKYLSYQEIRPLADIGWLEIVNNTYSKLYNISFGSNDEMYIVSNNDTSLFYASRDFSNYLNHSFSFLSHCIKVPYTTTDYIYVSKSYGDEPITIGDKITVSPGETVTVSLSTKY